MKFFKLAAALFLTLIVVGCNRVQPIMNFEDTPVAYELQSQDVKAAIIKAASARDWLVKEVKEGELDAKLYVRSHFAEVSITYSNKFYSINYVRSENLKESDGNIHRNYNRWVNNLNVDIQKQLSIMAASK
ncbi:hypothetical protein [Vibrio sp. 99-8-1]|uniref:hypothetical protein n=1 Tax=Vibrio sp. 99-8-1 TaxID=2607602 RepID=UPI001493DD54|nr:hypothetical protein [Vibrio sp. 99-8-1]NOI68253.1 hypothetical protein [Vibrio sp. 99-8-1]